MLVTIFMFVFVEYNFTIIALDTLLKFVITSKIKVMEGTALFSDLPGVGNKNASVFWMFIAVICFEVVTLCFEPTL